MPFSLLFSVDSRLHTLFACFSTISAQIVRADYPRLLCGFSAAITRILRGRYADYLRRSARLSTAVRAEQPRNSAEKVKFSVSRTVHILDLNRYILHTLSQFTATSTVVTECTYKSLIEEVKWGVWSPSQGVKSVGTMRRQ